MSELSKLFGKARAVSDAATPPPAPPASAPSGGFKIGGPAPSKSEGEVPESAGSISASPPAPSGFQIGGSGRLAPPTSEPEASASQAAAQPPVPAPKPSGFKIGAGGPSNLPAPVQSPAVANNAAPEAEPKQESERPEAPLTVAAPTPAFSDETPASRPQRELPPDVEEAVARFVANLERLHELTPEPELASSAIRQVMVELKSNPQYIKHVMPGDVRVMIQIMRETMGLAKAVKEKKVATRKAKVKPELDAIMAELSDLDDLG